MPEFSNDFSLIIWVAALGTVAILMLLLFIVALKKLGSGGERGATMPDREALTLDEFYEAYYAADKLPRAVVLDVVVRFAAAGGVQAKYLRPEDSFTSIGARDAEACEQFAVVTAVAIKEAERRFGASLFSGKLHTLDDYVRTIVLAERLVARAAAAGRN